MARNRSSVSLDVRGLGRLARRLEQLGPSARTVMQRAAGTLARRLPVEASRQVADKVLNAPKSKIRPLLSARSSGADGAYSVVLQGLRKRLPLHEFTGARWAGRKAPGAVVKVWRDSPAKAYTRATSKKDTAVFAKHGRGAKAGLYQRVHNRSRERAPIVLRKGPELSRAITEREHGDIYPDLVEFGQSILREEIARLLRSKG